MTKHADNEPAIETEASIARMVKLAAEECITIPAEDFNDSDWVNAQVVLIERIQRQPWHDTDKNYDPEVVQGQIRLAVRQEATRLLK